MDLLAEPLTDEDPALGALDFTQELDPAWLIVDTVIGEGEPCCFLWVAAQSHFLPAFPAEPCWPLFWPQSSQMRSSLANLVSLNCCGHVTAPLLSVLE